MKYVGIYSSFLESSSKETAVIEKQYFGFSVDSCSVIYTQSSPCYSPYVTSASATEQFSPCISLGQAHTRHWRNDTNFKTTRFTLCSPLNSRAQQLSRELHSCTVQLWFKGQNDVGITKLFFKPLVEWPFLFLPLCYPIFLSGWHISRVIFLHAQLPNCSL